MSLIPETKLIKVLQSYNPWWQTQTISPSLTKPNRRVVFNDAIKILDHKTVRRFAIISGARRVGKTTLLNQIIEEKLLQGVRPGSILYVSFDNPIIKMISIDDVLETYESLFTQSSTIYLFFDEIQYADNWELWMKVLYDSRPDIKLIATGSSSPVLEKGASDSGTGRWSVLKMPTLSFYEYCELLNIGNQPTLKKNISISELSKYSKGELARITNQFTPLIQHFNRYMTVGGFPELALASDDIYAQRILREDVVDKVIKRDVPALYRIRNPLSMEKLFLYLCMTSSRIFVKQDAAKELKNITVNTIEEYVKFLDNSNLIYISNPTMVGITGALKGKPKIYIADAAIRNAVLMLDDVISDDTDMGIMAETVVYKHLVSFYRNEPSVNLGYYRKARDTSKEVDIVIDYPKDRVLVEVKYRNNTSVSASDSIISLSKEKNTNIKQSFIVTKNVADYGLANHDTLVPVFRIPVIVFTYLLGMFEATREHRRL